MRAKPSSGAVSSGQGGGGSHAVADSTRNQSTAARRKAVVPNWARPIFSGSLPATSYEPPTGVHVVPSVDRSGWTEPSAATLTRR